MKDLREAIEAGMVALQRQADQSTSSTVAHVCMRHYKVLEQSLTAPEAASRDGLKDAHVVHVNMLRGEIARLTPAQVAHLYSDEECAAILAEIQRQHPSLRTPAATPKDYEALRQLRTKACRAWRFDLKRQEALDLLYELKGMAQDSYTPEETPSATQDACTVCGGRKCSACWDYTKDRPWPTKAPSTQVDEGLAEKIRDALWDDMTDRRGFRMDQRGVARSDQDAWRDKWCRIVQAALTKATESKHTEDCDRVKGFSRNCSCEAALQANKAPAACEHGCVDVHGFRVINLDEDGKIHAGTKPCPIHGKPTPSEGIKP